MKFRDIFRFLLGDADAIQRVAASREAVWIGVVLVFLTSFARNYDQTPIAENPFLWFCGGFLFSLLSGTWLYLVAYEGFCRNDMLPALRPRRFQGWRSFMGLYWMTAPAAWIYAIPIEYVLGTLGSARFNLILLGFVALWRVALMTRCFMVACGVQFGSALVRVLFAASVEILLLSFLGQIWGDRFLRGMGGLRNSPEEDLLLAVLGNAFGISLFLAPASLIACFGSKSESKTLPELASRSEFPVRRLGLVALFWILLTIPFQLKLASNFRAEKLAASNSHEELMAFLSSKKRSDFAPSRQLPPKAYEFTTGEQLAGMLRAASTNDQAWVQQHLAGRFDQFCDQYRARRSRAEPSDPRPAEYDAHSLNNMLRSIDGVDVQAMLLGLEKTGPGKVVLLKNRGFLEELQLVAGGRPVLKRPNSRPEHEQEKAWDQVRVFLENLLRQPGPATPRSP